MQEIYDTAVKIKDDECFKCDTMLEDCDNCYFKSVLPIIREKLNTINKMSDHCIDLLMNNFGLHYLIKEKSYELCNKANPLKDRIGISKEIFENIKDKLEIERQSYLGDWYKLKIGIDVDENGEERNECNDIW